MAFFQSAVGVLQTLVVALGAGLGIWGAINLMEGCILSIGNPQNCHQNSLFLEREFLVFVRTRFLHSEVLSGASMHAASDNFSRRT